ncbi:putative Transcriptional regulator, AraC family [Verrucomicrobia bacterium]|nr:putative Transcriptional regulator, AraC family [Verrucomicrobiota bacterium]
MVKSVAFEDLVRLPVVQDYVAAFRKATGVSLKVVPPDEAQQRTHFGPGENAFCTLAAGTRAGCVSCSQVERRAVHNAARKRVTQQVYCYAGLTVVAMPVMMDGRHLATLLSGQVFRREPTERDFAIVAGMLGEGTAADWEKKARKAYFETPVVTAERFQAIVQLLSVFAHYLADFAGRYAVAASEAEPDAVANAKQFVQARAADPITLNQIVEHVHVSRFYFCKLFKKSTGMTLTEYVSRVRIEKAKSLLIDPSLRISEIVFAAGFGSIPRFNSAFKQYVGMPPGEYRATQRSQLLT